MVEMIYQLTVQGELTDNLQPAFPGMTLALHDGNTTLTGDLPDQAALQGLLQRMAGLGLVLLEVKTLDGGAPRPRRQFERS